VYLAWCVGLVGAVIAAALGDWNSQRAFLGVPKFAPGVRLTVALSVLADLRAARRRGEVRQRRELLQALNLSAFVVETILGQLADARYVTRVGRDGWILARDLDETTVYDLYMDLGLGVDRNSVRWMRPTAWRHRAGQTLIRFDSLGRECLGLPLKDLFAEDEPPEAEIVPFPRS